MKYSNIEKKYNQLCFVTTQSGSIFYLKPIINFLKKKKIPFLIYSNKKTKKTWKSNNIHSKLISTNEIKQFKKFKVLIMSSVVNSDIEKKIILNKHKENYIIQFIDHCVLLKERFIYKKKIILPNEIWALDILSKNKIYNFSKKFTKIYNMGHPGIEILLKKSLNTKKNIVSSKKKKILVVLQPLRKIKKLFKQDEFDMIKFCEQFKKKFKNNYIFKYALHPDHKRNDFRKFKDIISIKEQNKILKFDYLISFFSSLLHLGYYLNIPSASLVLKSHKIPFIFPGKNRIKIINNEKSLINFFKTSKSKFNTNNEIKNSFQKTTARIEKLYYSKILA